VLHPVGEIRNEDRLINHIFQISINWLLYFWEQGCV
jgi:hypothetical protein